MLRPSTILTERELAGLLTDLGFVNEPISLKSRQIMLSDPQEDMENVPCRYVLNGSKDMLGPVIVSIENSQFCVYNYSEWHHLFKVWGKLSGDVSEKDLYAMILAASKALNT
jgi:hypothetical protein